MKGTHNSYKLKPLFNLWALGINLMIPDFQYQHDPLRVQLNNDVRHFELDVHFGDSGRILNYHLPELDKETHCRCFLHCWMTRRTSASRRTRIPPCASASTPRNGTKLPMCIWAASPFGVFGYTSIWAFLGGVMQNCCIVFIFVVEIF